MLFEDLLQMLIRMNYKSLSVSLQVLACFIGTAVCGAVTV